MIAHHKLGDHIARHVLSNALCSPPMSLPGVFWCGGKAFSGCIAEPVMMLVIATSSCIRRIHTVYSLLASEKRNL